jgi:hypothetical protein
MPSPLFNVLFLVAFFVPAAMCVAGVLFLMASLFLRHYRVVAARRWHVIEARAH